MILCESVNGTLLSSPEMTAKWEIYLKKIGQRKGSQENFLKNIEKFIHHLISEATKQLESSQINEHISNVKAELVIGIVINQSLKS
ncbi:hypothetical protein [Metabacillus fastidiosus]|uniref:hypothetical protein n=1 Tax=Metabacillus fastidiosus TaxID=1458 RepID=UPI003D2C8326